MGSSLILSTKIMLSSDKSDINQNLRIKEPEGFGRRNAAEFSVLSARCSSYHRNPSLG